MKRQKNINNVNLSYLSSKENSAYSDGDTEDQLLKIYSSDNPVKEKLSVLSNNPSWSLFYHLSPLRGNVINWYSFTEGSSVLEVGAGCGAITEELLSLGLNVTALELTDKRALINAHRNKQSNKLSIVVGNLKDYRPKKKFDYIVCVGVLEYSGMFIDAEDPYKAFIEYLSDLLTENGKLIVAIENKIGLKYWAGAREDHTNSFFDGLNNYPESMSVKTFGRKELEELFLKSGMKHTDFYYPFPDYKHPAVVFSDRYQPGPSVEFPLRLLPTPTPGQSRVHLFSEALAMMSIESNDLYRHFSNSFIVVASNKNIQTDDQPDMFVNQANRKDKYRISTKIKSSNNQKLVIKKALTPTAKKHVNNMVSTYDSFSKIFKKADLARVKSISEYEVSFEHIEGSSLERKILLAILDNSSTSYLEDIDRFIDLVKDQKHDTNGLVTKNEAILDLNFDNIIVDGNKWTIIDYEWLNESPVSLDYLISRAFSYFFIRHSDIFSAYSEKIDFVGVFDDMFVPAKVYDKFEKYFLLSEDVLRKDLIFQKKVMAFTNSPNNRTSNKEPKIIQPDRSILDIYLYDMPDIQDRLALASQENELLKKEVRDLREWQSKVKRIVAPLRPVLPIKTYRRIKRSRRK